MTPGAPAGPEDRGEQPRREPVEMSEAEKLAVQREARHDVAARGSRGDPLGLQHYLARARSGESRRPAEPDRPPPGAPGAAPSPAGTDSGTVPAGQPGPGGAAHRRPRVVVGMDGSSGARAALEAALVEAARRGAALDVVTAVPLATVWSGGAPVLGARVDAIRAHAARQAREQLGQVRGDEAIAAVPGVAAVDVQVRAAEGYPARVLLAAAEGAELLVVGNRGRGTVRSALLGSVALHCVSHAPCPVLVVHPAGAPERPLRVAAGVDGSAGSRAALAVAIEEAARVDGEVEVVAAYELADYWTDLEVVGSPPVEQIRDTVRDGVDGVVEQVLAGRTAAAPVPVIRRRVVQGSAGDTLVDRACGAYRLVVGSRGHGMLRGLLLGSVALHCAMRAPAPVLVVRPEHAGTQAEPPRPEPAMAGR
ncbi:universal stress protein [Geodermatophilus ruber]|uniref:Nucleotide-binding universal stress protein, UspA family n=1 Tax=Geodermatophilus ruber TaxID=504800 RepID=A0A1I4CCH8_9ACTN|nr:universal stress protein [Geodermatophilus ruber]SFK77731.1 Nucleotide-binding universal stress protein, UspA family [Geodermatophilus ruber]